MDHAPARPVRRRPTLRAALVALVLVCTVPAALVAAGAVYQDYLLRKERVFESAISTARNLVAEVERELHGIEAGLRVLATAEDLARGDMESFYRRIEDALRLQNVDGYLLIDPQGMQVLNTDRHYPAVPVRSAIPAGTLSQAIDERKTAVSGLFHTAIGGELTLAVSVPVEIGATVPYTLSAGIRPIRISQILQRHQLDTGWVAAALDSNAVIVGRSRDDARYIGQSAVGSLAESIKSQREGTLQSETKEGIPVLTAFTHSTDAQWAVAVGAPIAELAAGLRRSMLLVMLTGGAIILSGMLLAYRLGRMIEASVAALIEPAVALGNGGEIEVPATRFRETAALGDALTHASQMLIKTQELAYHDPLTALSNRLLFRELALHALAAAQRTGRPVALLALDLDNFKEVNDRNGHGLGDLVLRIAADRMRNTLRSADIVARFGGDEFVVLLEDTDRDQAMRLAEELIRALSAPYPAVLQQVGASAGIAMFPQDAADLDSLLELADRALYAAKAAGRGRAHPASPIGGPAAST